MEASITENCILYLKYNIYRTHNCDREIYYQKPKNCSVLMGQTSISEHQNSVPSKIKLVAKLSCVFCKIYVMIRNFPSCNNLLILCRLLFSKRLSSNGVRGFKLKMKQKSNHRYTIYRYTNQKTHSVQLLTSVILFC